MSDPLFDSYLSVPWKAVYVRRKKDPNKCLICAIVQKIGGVKSWEVFRDKLAIVLLNRFPYNPGHLLISPLEHYEEYEALPAELASHLTIMVQRGIKLLKLTHQPMGFNIGLNLGVNIAGGSIKHIHWHLVPRYIGDLNFMEILGTRVLIETLEETLSILKEHAEKSFSFED